MATRAEQLGDPTLEELYVEERVKLARSTRRLVGDDRAEDLVQDAFVTYLTHGSGVTFPRAWLGKVARNRALNDLRRAREVPLDRDVSAEARPASAEREAVRGVVLEALRALDDRSRRALQLRFFEERDYPDIAEELAVRLPQAHVVVHRAVRRLGREIVRRLAAAHDASACAAALEEMAGLGNRSNGHGPEPCARCRPVLDELSALRGLEAMLPVGLVPSALRRLAGEVAARAPIVQEPAGQVVTAIVGIGMALASLGVQVPDARAPSPREARPAPAPAVVTEFEGDRAPDRTTTRAPSREPPASRTVPAAPERVADARPVTIDDGGDHTQADVNDGGEPVGGVVVCEPLEPCPPPPDE